MSNSLLAKAFGVRSLGRGDALRPLDLTPFFLHSSYAFTRSIVSRQLPLRSTATSRLYRPCRSSRSLHCILAAPAALDRYLGGCTGHVAHPVRSILLFPKSFEQFAQARGRLIAIQLACGDIEHERFPIFDWQFLRWEELVRLEKDQARRQSGPFIAVDERVITTKIKEISRGDLDWVGNQRTARHCRLRCGDRRLEQIFVAEARRTAVCGENFRMDRLYRRDREMRERFAHERRLNKAAFFRIKRFAVVPALAGSRVGWTGVRTIDPPSCRVTVSLSPTFTRARSIRAASKMIPWEFPILETVLVMA